MSHSRVLKGGTKGLQGMYNNPKATYAIFPVENSKYRDTSSGQKITNF
jgi:hypothetical protein